MSQDNHSIAEAINLAEVAAHPTEAIIALIETVRRQEGQIRSLGIRQDRDYERFSGDILDHGKRIKTLEGRRQSACTPGRVQSARLGKLEALLIARGNEPLTFSEIGKYLELGTRCGKTSTRRQNMTLLGKIIANDERFNVFDSNTQKGTRMVCLTDDYFSRGLKKM